jgi:signal transduction histidine kinase
MKANQFYKILVALVVLTTTIACNKKSDDPDAGKISQLESDKLLVSTTAGVTSTGFSAAFASLISDSLERVAFTRFFTDPIRYFEDGSGYFFVLDFNGWNVAHPANKELQGGYHWDLTDSKGNYFIRTMTEVASTAGFGFVEYYWRNPATDEDELKLSYVHAIEGIDYLIGSGVYIGQNNPLITKLESNKEIAKNLTMSTALGFGGVFEYLYTDFESRQQFLRTFNDPISFFEDSSGYFFIFQFDGLCLAHGFNNELEGTNIYDIQDTRGTYFIREMSALAQAGGGFSEYYWTNPSSGMDEKKISYVHPVPGTNIWVGAGVYIE